MRQYIGAIIGAALGVAGGILYMQSMPPPEESQAARAEEAEQELRRAQRELWKLRSRDVRARRRPTEEARSILEDVRSGRGADLDDIFAITKPWLRDLAPVINLMRVRQEKEQFHRLAGTYGRNYDLNERQQKALQQWLEDRARENAARFVSVLERDSSTIVDLMEVGRESAQNIKGIDAFMERQLSGEALEAFRHDRMIERVASVEAEANGRLNRLDQLVELDSSQEDELFYLMARSSEDYVPSMDIEGMTGAAAPLDRSDRNAGIQSVLRPEQLEAWELHREERRAEAEQEMREVGLRLPKDWDFFDDYDW